jgi:HNH endonuclease
MFSNVNRKILFCSRRCKALAQRRRETVICRCCGRMFDPRWRDGELSPYCSHRCYLDRRWLDWKPASVRQTERAAERAEREAERETRRQVRLAAEPPAKLCIQCGNEIKRQGRQHTWCSPECKRRNLTKVCPRCGEIFVAHNRKTRCCSKACADQLRRLQVCRLDRRRVYSPAYRHQLAEEHGWMCWVCEEPIDPTLNYPDLLSVSVDHVIPLARRGTNRWENLRPAHLICNSQRGDRLTLHELAPPVPVPEDVHRKKRHARFTIVVSPNGTRNRYRNGRWFMATFQLRNFDAAAHEYMLQIGAINREVMFGRISRREAGRRQRSLGSPPPSYLADESEVDWRPPPQPELPL